MLYKRSHFPVRITKHTCRDMYEMNNNGTEIGVNKYWEQNKKSQVQSTQRVDVGKKKPNNTKCSKDSDTSSVSDNRGPIYHTPNVYRIH